MANECSTLKSEKPSREVTVVNERNYQASRKRVRAWFRADLLHRLSGPVIAPRAPKRIKPKPERRIVVRPAKPKARKSSAPHRHGMTGVGPWNRIGGLTQESAMQGILAGKSIAEIAKELGCNFQTVSTYLIAARKEVFGFRAAEDEMKVCACGHAKKTHRPKCIRCLRKSTPCRVEGCTSKAHTGKLCHKHNRIFKMAQVGAQSAPVAPEAPVRYSETKGEAA